MGDLTPEEKQLISNGITIAGNSAGIALGFAGIPGAGPVIAGIGNLFFQIYAPSENPEEAYYEALSRQIAQLETTLLDKLSEINSKIQSLGTSLTNLINEIGLQIDLRAYDQARNVIDQYYNDLIDFTRATRDPATSKGAARDLYELLTSHADEVAIQMQNLHDTLLPGQDGLPGLLNRQLDVVQRKVIQWVQDTSNYDGGTLTFERNPNQFKAYKYALIFTEAYKEAAVQAINDYVVPILSAILTLQYRGLTFLIIAWGGTARTEQIKTHINNAENIIDGIDRLISNFSKPEVVDTFISNALQNITLQPAPALEAVTGPGPHFFDFKGYYFWDTGPLKLLKIEGDLKFGVSYDSVTVVATSPPGRPLEPPYFGYPLVKQSRTVVPDPGIEIPTPLSPALSQVAMTLQGTLGLLGGPQIVLSEVPSPAGGTLAGQVTGLKPPESPGLFAFAVTGTKWLLQAHDVALGTDGAFSVEVADSAALFWGLLVAKPGWQWTGAQQNAAPSLGPDVLAYLTVPVAPKR